MSISLSKFILKLASANVKKNFDTLEFVTQKVRSWRRRRSTFVIQNCGMAAWVYPGRYFLSGTAGDEENKVSCGRLTRERRSVKAG